jgi:TonB family protein
MLINHQLKVSLLISCCWHLFCFSFFSIAFLPSGYRPNRYPTVSFSGSILKGPVFIRQPAPAKQIVELPLPQDLDPGRGRFSQSPDALFLPGKKQFLLNSFSDIDALEKTKTTFSSQKKVSSQREVIFRPSFPYFPEWAGAQKEWPAFTVFEVYISADGLVEQPVCLQGSGNPEIDARLIRYISRWRFTPLGEPEYQKQTVRVDLEFR